MKYEQCEWCSSLASYRIECREKDYVRYSCAGHARKTEQLADLDLGTEVIRKHTSSSAPFPAEAKP